MGTEPLERKLAAILYADVAGYSRLTGVDEDGTHRALRAYLDAVTSHIQARKGRVVHYAGDAVLAEFGTVSNALRCAIDVQHDVIARNQNLPDDRKIRFRIGVNLGEVIVDRDEIYGDGVNVAARLESLADPGGICISQSVRTAIGKKLPVDYESLGVQQYFADGITEDITTALSNTGWYYVTARNSAFYYKGKAIDVRQVGRELGVQYILEGSVRKMGERVRMTAQLIETLDGKHIWGQRYDGRASFERIKTHPVRSAQQGAAADSVPLSGSLRLSLVVGP